MEFDNLGQLSQKLSLMSNQAYGFKKDTRFNKQHDIADIYNQFLEKADQMEDSDDDQEVAAAVIMWGQGAVDHEPALDQADQGHIRLRRHQG
jgi:hypothetical protein